MPESEQYQGPEESTAGEGSASRAETSETPANWPAPGDASQEGPDREEAVMGGRPEPKQSAADEGTGDEADAVTHASPPAAKPGEKKEPAEQDPDMKDMAVGPRPADDQAAG